MTNAQQLANMLKENSAFDRIMQRLLAKYESYGEHKGKIQIRDATQEECDALNGFIAPKKSFRPPTVSLRIEDFEKAISETNYAPVAVKDLLEAYFHQNITTTAEQKQAARTEWNTFADRLLTRFHNTPYHEWLSALFRHKTKGYSQVFNEYHADKQAAEQLLIQVGRAVNARFDQQFDPILLAVLSADITGDSHYFDANSMPGKLLLNVIAFYAETNFFRTNAEKLRLYEFFGIETNSMMGTVAILGIRLWEQPDKEHEGFRIFAERKEPILLSDKNLRSISFAASNRKIVCAVENPSVFTALVPCVSACNCGLLCTFGQVKTVGLQLLSMLVQNGCLVYYAGDFDPEGLQIADKLIQRFGAEHIIPWRMSEKDYLGLQKNPNLISDRRLAILQTLQSDALRQTAHQLQQQKKAAYQELLIGSLMQDIREQNAIP